MKRIVLFMVVLLSFTANSCKKDDIQTILDLLCSVTSKNVTTFGGNDGSITITISKGNGDYRYKVNGVDKPTNVINGLSAGTYDVSVTDKESQEFTSAVTITQPTPPELTVTTTQSNVTTFGGSNGSITVTATGGVGGYTYSKDGTTFQSTNVFSSLTANTYSITVKSGTDSKTVSNIVITQPSPDVLNVTLTTTNVTTNGASDGIITVTATGGTGTYTYSKNGTTFQTSNIFNGLSVGTYTITVKSGDQTKTLPATINQPDVLSANVSFTNVTTYGLSDGTITITATGGVGTYTYSKNGTTFQTSNVFNSLSAGTYTITIKSGTVTPITKTVSITQPISVTTSQVNVTTFGGSNGSITVNALGGNGSFTYSKNGGSFQSSNVFSGLTATTYSITVVSGDQTKTVSGIVITQPTPSALNVSTTQTNVTTYGGNSGSIDVTVNGGTGTYTYKLNSGSFQTSNVFGSLTSGTYSVTVNDTYQTKTVSGIVITQPTLLTVTETHTNVTCGGSNDGSITVTANGGSGNYTYKLNSGDFQSSNVFSGLLKGTHSVTVTDGDQVKTINIVVGEPSPLALTSTFTNPTMSGGNGQITLTATGGNPNNYYYSLNGTINQSSNVFNVPAGTYTPSVMDACSQVTISDVIITNPLAPTVNTLGYTNLTINSVTLNGSVNANNSSTTSLKFQYGLTTSYGTEVVLSNVSGSTLTNVSTDLVNLIPNTTYHYRVVATNGNVTTNGNDMTFTTVSCKVGDEMFGGIVFYVDGTGKHGLVVQKSNYLNSTWSDVSVVSNGATWVLPTFTQLRTLISANVTTFYVIDTPHWVKDSRIISSGATEHGFIVPSSSSSDHWYGQSANAVFRLITTF